MKVSAITRNWDQIVIYIIVSVLGLAIVIPFVWLIGTAFKPASEIFTMTPRFIPQEPTLANFRQILARYAYLRSFLNSLIVSTAVTVSSALSSTMVGYGISRYKVVGANFVFILLLTTVLLIFLIWNDKIRLTLDFLFAFGYYN